MARPVSPGEGTRIVKHYECHCIQEKLFSVPWEDYNLLFLQRRDMSCSVLKVVLLDYFSVGKAWIWWESAVRLSLFELPVIRATAQECQSGNKLLLPAQWWDGFPALKGVSQFWWM